MTKIKQNLSQAIGIRLPMALLSELESCAAQQQRSLSQEIRFRLLESSADYRQTDNLLDK